jgi:hypothetical protein
MDTIGLLAMLLSRNAMLLFGTGRFGIRFEQGRTACGFTLALKTDEYTQCDGDGQGQQAKVNEEPNCHDGDEGGELKESVVLESSRVKLHVE